jgi:muramoyltetrapeptide carboxypeptidase
MIIPPLLESGDRIRIISPAGKVQRERVLPGIELLQNSGFDVRIGTHVFGQHFQFSGTDKQRAYDFQEAIDDPNTKAIICSRGGYGSVRIIDKVNFDALPIFPKWLIGFSDITVLHAVFNRMSLATIHGPMPAFFLDRKKPNQSYLSLMNLLHTGNSEISGIAHPLNRNGAAAGELVGGNLSLLYSLQATPWQLNTAGKILLIEDVGEYYYHLDRMMNNLRLTGILKDLAGLVVGGFTEMKDNESPFGKSVNEIISEAVQDYNFPVCFDFPIGHFPKNLPVMLGANYQLSVGDDSRLMRIQS